MLDKMKTLLTILALVVVAGGVLAAPGHKKPHTKTATKHAHSKHVAMKGNAKIVKTAAKKTVQKAPVKKSAPTKGTAKGK